MSWLGLVIAAVAQGALLVAALGFMALGWGTVALAAAGLGIVACSATPYLLWKQRGVLAETVRELRRLKAELRELKARGDREVI